MMRRLLVALALLALTLPAAAIDRQALTITRYHLDVQMDRASHVMAVTGKITLRNDSRQPQKVLTLQISSSLTWNVILLDDKPVPWMAEDYTSDIDHTGVLTEAVVNLPQPVAPAASITLGVQYGGAIVQDSTRLTRMGAPAAVGARNDWDQISDSFTAIRGLGYVVWYPVAIDAVSMSEGNSVFDAIAGWQQHHRLTSFFAHIGVASQLQEHPCILSNLPTSAPWRVAAGASPDQANATPSDAAGGQSYGATLQVDELNEVVPAFTILPECSTLSRPTVEVVSTAAHADAAKNYALAAEASDPLLHDWLDRPSGVPRVLELADQNANPWQSGSVLFTPLRQGTTANLQLLLLPAQVAARFQSAHLWLQDGVERFLQAVSVEGRSGHKAALDFLDQYEQPLVQAEDQAHPTGDKAADNTSSNTLLNTNDELYLRGKGGFVLWMLRGIVGDEALQRALAQYHAGADKDPEYFQKLLQTLSKRDLEWFFDDWVYRDRGLPEFHIASAYTRPMLSESLKSYMVTVTIENRGHASAEVPVMAQTADGDTKTVRVLVKAGQTGVGRIEMPAVPVKVIVNDGSVPEANHGNNTYDLPPVPKS